MQAIILAAGMGKRLKNLTQNNTKCMVKVCGVTLIERMLRQLERHDLKRIVVVVGYEAKGLIDFISTLGIRTRIEYVENPVYDTTNNIYSLYLACDKMAEDDTLLFESDIIFEERLLDGLIDDPRDTLALVDRYEPWMDGTCVKLNDSDEITDFIPGRKFRFDDSGECFKTVNIYKFSKDFSENCYIPFLKAYQKACGVNEYYEQAINLISRLDEPGIRARRLRGERWYEIDDIQDLDIAESLFESDPARRLDLFEKRRGGYWRYPKLAEFVSCRNGFFPPEKILDEIKSSFEDLILSRPSGASVLSLVAAKDFGGSAENVIVFRDLGSMIRAWTAENAGKVGIIGFDEGQTGLPENSDFVFCNAAFEDNFTFGYIADFIEKNRIKSVVLATPDRISGAALKKDELLKLVSWTKERGVRLACDATFAEFSDDCGAADLTEICLPAENDHLFVLRDIAEAYGMNGLGLSVMVAGGSSAAERMKRDLSNLCGVDAFAEYFMQVFEKYKKKYCAAIRSFCAERARVEAELSKIEAVRLYRSQSTKLLIELKAGCSRPLAERLLAEYAILVERPVGLGEKFIRIALREPSENDRLIGALREIL